MQIVVSKVMLLKEVNDKKTARQFLHLPLKINAGDQSWIRPLDKDIENIFDPNKNPFFKHGNIIRWILIDKQDKVIGRVAAFTNSTYQKDIAVGGVSLFECINDQQAANLLFDKCKEWLKMQGMETMDGPINFGEKNYWWGVLVDGFAEPAYGMSYNPPYYQSLFENYGFKLYYKQLTFGLDIYQPKMKEYEIKAAPILENKDFTFEHVDKNNLEKYAADFMEVYNVSWGKFPGFKEMSKEKALAALEKMRPVLVEDLCWFGYHRGKPITFFLILPDLNQYFKHVKGKMNLLGKIIFLWHKWRKTVTNMSGLGFAITPEFQGKGIEAAMITVSRKHVLPQKRWKTLELTWIGDFNPKMHTIARNVGAEIIKTHITYRYHFDLEKPVLRHPFLD